MIKILSKGEFIESHTQKVRPFKGKTEIKVHTGSPELLKEEIEKVSPIKYASGEAIEALEDVIGRGQGSERFGEALKKYLPFSEEGVKEEIKNIKEAARFTLSMLYVDEKNISTLSESLTKAPVGTILWKPAPFTSPLEAALKIFASVISGNHIIITPSAEDAPGIFFLLKFLLSHPHFKMRVSLIPVSFSLREEWLNKVGRAYISSDTSGNTCAAVERRGNSIFVVMEEEGINPALKKALRAMLNFFGFSPLSPNIILVRESIYYDFLSVLLRNMENLSMEGFGTNIQANLINIREKVLEAGGKFLIGGLVEKSFKLPAVASELPLSLTLREELFSPLIFVYTFERKEEIFQFLSDSPAIMSVSIFGGEREIAMEIAERTPVESINVGGFPPQKYFFRLKGREGTLFQGRGPQYLLKELTCEKLVRIFED